MWTRHACFGVDGSDPKQAQIPIGKKDPSRYRSDRAWKINVEITEGHWTAPNVRFYAGGSEIGGGAQNVVIGELVEVLLFGPLRVMYRADNSSSQTPVLVLSCPKAGHLH